MKVLHVIPAIAPRYGGPSTAVIEMCRALKDVAVETLIATTDADGPHRLGVEHGKIIEHQGVSVIVFPFQFSESFKYSAPLTRWLKKNARLFDVVHIHAVFSHSSIAAARICRNQFVPYVVRPLGSLASWSLRRSSIRKKILWRFGVAMMLKGAESIHYTTTEEMQEAERNLKITKGVVIPLGISEDWFAETNAENFRKSFRTLGKHPFILMVSRIERKKKIDLVLKTFFRLVSEFPEWRVVVAGDGDSSYLKEIRSFVAMNNATERIVFPGWLDETMKRSAFREASLFVLLSLHENFGLAVLEAMASGAPVIVNQGVNLVGDIVNADAGWAVDHESADSLLDTFREAMSSSEQQKKKGAAGRRLAKERFLWKNVALSMKEHYAAISKVAG